MIEYYEARSVWFRAWEGEWERKEKRTGKEKYTVELSLPLLNRKF